MSSGHSLPTAESNQTTDHSRKALFQLVEIHPGERKPAKGETFFHLMVLTMPDNYPVYAIFGQDNMSRSEIRSNGTEVVIGRQEAQPR
jgi:hypothetical protein